MEKDMARVLIVDDVAENITVVKNILKSQYDVIAATTGEKVLELVSKEDSLPDLILLDIIMPEMDGFEVCKRLKENETTKNIPVIFLTVLDHVDDMVKGFEYGGVDYITKPFETNVLLARVNTHITLKQHQDNLIEMLKQKDKVLMQQSKLASLGEMFESVMHQWKQPLSIISTSNASIRVEKELDTLTEENLYKLLDGIDTTVEHLTQTMDVFRDYLLETNKKEYFSSKNIVERTLKLLEAQLDKEDIKIHLDIDECELFSFKNHIMQVLINILTNAIHTLQKKDTNRDISLMIKCDTNDITITIRDNGGGIQIDEVSKIFEKHFTTKENKKGTGLGLYICKQITETYLDGKISAQNINDGASFSIVLPIK